MTLDRLTCQQLRGVWLLDQPGDPDRLSAAFYLAVGASASDFEVLGEVDLPPTSDAAVVVEPPIRLLRDLRDADAAERECLAERQTR